MHSLNTFGAWTNHGQTRTYTIHHDPDLGEATTFPLIVFFVLGNRACTQMSFCHETPKLGVPKFPKLGLPQLWRPITSCADLRLRWGLKKNYNFHRELFNDMWHTICTQINHSDSWLLVIGSQINNLTPGPSFGHNLYFKYPNGSCEHILYIYVLRPF